MIYDLRNYEHDYIVQNDKIQYKLQDSISSNIFHGYKTMFAYYQEQENDKITKNSLNRNIFLNLYCGTFSYAEIPMIFQNIMGLSGTLKNMSKSEQTIIQDIYNIKRLTFIPSVYGDKNQMMSGNQHKDIAEIFQGVHSTVNLKKKKQLNFDFQFAIQLVTYRDYDCLKDQILQYSNWEINPTPLRKFIENIEAKGGGDYKEAIEIALLHVNNEHLKQPISQVILIGDAPAKDIESIKQYRKICGGEDYWNKSGIPLTDYKEQLIQLQSNQIPVHTFYLDDGCKSNFQMISDATKGQCKKMELNGKGKFALQNRLSEKILEDLQKFNKIEGNELVKAYRQKMGYTVDEDE